MATVTSAGSTAGPTATAAVTNTVDTSSNATGGLDSSLLQDETTLLQSGVPGLNGKVPLSTLPPIKGSVAALETQTIGLLGRVQASSSLSGATKSALIGQLRNLTLQLGPALDEQDRIETLRAQENVLLQAHADAQASVSKLAARLQVSLNNLRVGVQTAVAANVVAAVGSLTVTVSGSADTVQAQLGAKVNRLLVNVLVDLDVLHIATLNAVANVDTARLNVNLFALVKKLRLDLNLLLTNLKVTIKADVSAAIAAEASLTVSLAAEIDGLKADLRTNVDTQLGGLDGLLTSQINALNGTLASVSTTLQGLQGQVG